LGVIEVAAPIRVRFSGTIIFLGNLTSVLTGIIFTVLVARSLTSCELGAWFFLGAVISYFQVLENVLTYWASRDIPRGLRVAKTCIVSNFLISLPLTIWFIILSYYLVPMIGYPRTLFLIGGLFISIYYTLNAITSVIFSKEPHKLGLKNVIIDGCKIPLALVMLNYGLLGVIIAVVIANILFILYGLRISKKYFEEKLNFYWVKSRIKHSWLPLHESIIGYVSAASDSLIIGVLLSPSSLSLYGIALTLGRVMKYTSDLVSPIYPKILSKGEITLNEIKESFKFLCIFSIPLLIGGLLLNKALVGIFGIKYIDAAILLYFIFPAFFFSTIFSTMQLIVTAMDKVDAGVRLEPNKLLKSKLFTTQLINYVSIIILITGSVLLTPILGVIGPALARLCASITSLVMLYYIFARRILKVKLIFAGFKEILLSVIPMIIFLYFYNPLKFSETLLAILLGASLYFVALILVDKNSRKLLRLFIKEFSSTLHFH
jgi:O-antigen/teichoic acid export membrane protein